MALAVVFAHCAPTQVFVGGRNAVQLFYVISGFLISYILVEKRSYASARDFYINRYLRLWPVYAAVAVLTLVIYAALWLIPGQFDSFFQVYSAAPRSADNLLIFTNVFLFGQDWVMFAGVIDHDLVFTPDFQKSDVLLWHGLLVPPAWTLGVELTFYLVAPLIITNARLLLILLISSVLLRAYLISIGLGVHDPWTYRFFPTELVFFCAGALSHQILFPFYKARIAGKTDLAAVVATGFAGLLVVFYSIIPIPEPWRSLLLFVIFTPLVPLFFVFQKSRSWDRRLGDLSYPIYIGHWLIIVLVSGVLRKMEISESWAKALVSVPVVILFAVLLDKIVGSRIESIRESYRRPVIR